MSRDQTPIHEMAAAYARSEMWRQRLATPFHARLKIEKAVDVKIEPAAPTL